MKWYGWMPLLIVLFAACNKDEIKDPQAPPVMEYTDFNNKEIKVNEYANADLNKDGSKDIFLYTMHVGDALFNRDYLRYHILGSINNFFPVNNNEESPILSKGDTIAAHTFSGYEWYNATQLLIAQKVTEINPPVYWQGSWKEASHKYLPMRIQKGHDLYYGWIELSFDVKDEKIVMHRAAISRDANKGAKAGF